MGLLSAAFMVSYIIIAPLFGWLGDRMSRWLLVSFGVILWSLASGASGMPWPVALAHPFWILLLTRCFVGIGEAAYGPVAPTILSDFYPVAIRGKVLAWFFMAIPVGSALGYTLGGQVAAMEGWGWRWAFYLVVPPGLLLGALCLFMREPSRGQRKPGMKDYVILLRTPSYVLDTLGMTAMVFAMGGLGFWMKRFLEEHGAQALGAIQPVTLFGAMTALAGLFATLAGGILGDRLRDRFPGSYFLVSGVAMLVGFPMVLLAVWVPFPWAWVFIFLAVFCLFFNTGPSNTILANVTHPLVRSTAFAMNILVIHILGDVISPPLIGWIKGQFGLDIGFYVISMAILLGGVLWLWGARYLEEDTRLAPARLAAKAN
jgi:MFS family permease